MGRLPLDPKSHRAATTSADMPLLLQIPLASDGSHRHDSPSRHPGRVGIGAGSSSETRVSMCGIRVLAATKTRPCKPREGFPGRRLRLTSTHEYCMKAQLLPLRGRPWWSKLDFYWLGAALRFKQFYKYWSLARWHAGRRWGSAGPRLRIPHPSNLWSLIIHCFRQVPYRSLVENVSCPPILPACLAASVRLGRLVRHCRL
jgi:hypothetical protein